MKVALAVLSSVLALASTFFVVVLPFLILLENRRLVARNEDRHVSGVLTVGSLVGGLAIVLAPLGAMRDRVAWLWVPVAAEAVTFLVSGAYWTLSGLREKAEQQRRARRR
jgi:hypothetical protein